MRLFTSCGSFCNSIVDNVSVESIISFKKLNNLDSSTVIPTTEASISGLLYTNCPYEDTLDH